MSRAYWWPADCIPYTTNSMAIAALPTTGKNSNPNSKSAAEWLNHKEDNNMRHIPTIAFLVVFIDVFANASRGFTANESTLGAWIVGIAAALMLAFTAANATYILARKALVIYRWLRSKAKR